MSETEQQDPDFVLGNGPIQREVAFQLRTCRALESIADSLSKIALAQDALARNVDPSYDWPIEKKIEFNTKMLDQMEKLYEPDPIIVETDMNQKTKEPSEEKKK